MAVVLLLKNRMVDLGQRVSIPAVSSFVEENLKDSDTVRKAPWLKNTRNYNHVLRHTGMFNSHDHDDHRLTLRKCFKTRSSL